MGLSCVARDRPPGKVREFQWGNKPAVNRYVLRQL